MSKVAIFLAGILVGLFLSLYHIRSQQLREYDLGPQTGHAAADNQDEWDPCAEMAALHSSLPVTNPNRHRQGLTAVAVVGDCESNFLNSTP
jgi:hypothetical protein